MRAGSALFSQVSFKIQISEKEEEMTTEREMPNDLGYCRGSRTEKIAMLESKCRPQQQSSPDLSGAIDPGLSR